MASAAEVVHRATTNGTQYGQENPRARVRNTSAARHGDDLADVQVAGQHRGQVVLDGGRSGHVGARDPGRLQAPGVEGRYRRRPAAGPGFEPILP